MAAEPDHEKLSDVGARAHTLTNIGWPCQTPAAADPPETLVAFLYRLVRDGAPAPGDVENHAIQAGKSRGARTTYTNPHLEAYARSLATYLTVGS